jgi:hypothetical protein
VQTTPKQVSSPSIWIFVENEVDEDSRLKEVIDGLRDGGAAVTGPTRNLPADGETPDALVAVLCSASDPIDRRNDDKLELRLTPWHDRLIPLVVGTRPAVELKDLSQLRLPTTPPATVVQRILVVASVGGGALADLYRLEASAQRWDSDGRPRKMLLRGELVPAGLAVLGSAAGTASPLLGQYIASSAAYRRWRTRRSVVIAGAAAILMLVTGGIAVGQGRAASQAARQSEADRARAESVRLSRLAVDLIPLDPDLPWLLAADALRQDVTPEARQAGQRVVNLSRQHQSIPLPALPDALTSDVVSGRVAIHYVDDSVEIRSGDDGRLLATPTAVVGPASYSALAPGGGKVLLGKDQSDTQVFDIESGRAVGSFKPTDVVLGWVDAHRIAVRRAETLTILDMQSGSATATAVHLPDAIVKGWSTSESGDIGYLAFSDTLISVDLRSGRALPPVSLAGAEDVAASADGSTALVAMGQGHPRLVRRAGPALEVNTLPAGIGHRVAAVGGGWALGDESGNIGRIIEGQDSVSPQFLADRGPLAGLGALSHDRLASVGGERFLRLWAAPHEARRPLVLARTSRDVLGQFVYNASVLAAGGSTESARPMIVRDPTSGDVTYTLQSPQLVGVIDGSTLEPRSAQNYLGDITSLTRPLIGGRIAYFFESGWTAVLDAATGATVWSRAIGTGLSIPVTATGASPTGDVLAVADRGGLRSWSVDGEIRTLSFAQQETPVAVLVDRSKQASVVTAAGRWYQFNRPPAILSSAPDQPVRTAVLGQGGTLYWVLENGSVQAFRDGNTREIARLSPDLAPFAMRASDDSDLIAVVGPGRTVVLSSGSGSTVLDLPNVGSDRSQVRDVAIAGSTMWVLRADQSIARVTIASDDDVRRLLTDGAPRPATAEERAETADAVSVFGAR